MKVFKILICLMFVFVISACHDKKTIYEYPDDDITTAEKGDIGDPCKKNGDCKDGLVCQNKVCSEPAEKDDEDKDSDDSDDTDSDTDTNDNDDSDPDTDTDDNDDSDSDTDTNDEDEPDDNDTQPDEDEDSDTTPYNPECGNGITEMGEECDDGFANSDEPGTYSTCRTNCKFARCGDSITDDGEACDDGNRLNGDYCSADCSEITGWCGDGKIQVGTEACDNAEPNTGSREGIGDYCANDCSGIVGSCGDGIKQNNEACDNAEPGEGGGQGIGPHYCSSDCSAITGWCGDGIQQDNETCDDGTDNGKYNYCNTTCTGMIYCGDGIVQPAYEKCDDGNNEDGDYCSADCQTADGSCGDGKIQWFEICDKADPSVGEHQGIGAYCSDDCKQVLGECGDGNVDEAAGEECDEGPNPNTDCTYGTVIGCEVCSKTCRKIPGKRRYCGDGTIQSEYEVCDDGNTVDGDYCSANCKTVTGSCGDGIKQDNEACDTALDPYCSSDCKTITGSCGDGIKNGTEECDLGANNGKTDCDYGENCKVCTANCIEIDGIRHYCGDGTKDTESGENCDDGDMNGSYNHCKPDCSGIGEHCGDGIENGNEDCDLGEGVNGTITDCAYGENCKVCTANCIEIDGNTSFCGDSRVDPDNEVCDKALDPYCSDDCQSVTGECGDGTIQPNEACDRADPSVGEGQGTGAYCSFDCTQSYGYCGDGTKNGPETCDDGVNNGKYNTTGKVHYCNSSCSAYDSGYCGDSRIQNSSCGGDPDCTEKPDADEECDYGSDNGQTDCPYNEPSCTVCNSNCKLRDGVTSRCGDGKLDTANGEVCDNADPSVGEHQGIGVYCADDCLSVVGSCGDGTVQTNEICDKADPSVGNGEGIGAYCSSNCQTLLGECGDGTIQPNETCDKADPGVGEGQGIGAYCSFDCTQSFGYCGDGVWQNEIEVCEKTLDPYCSDDCQSVTGSCGDGTVQANEACDKADPSVGAGEGTGAYCSADCQSVTGYCGDGDTLEGVETCDDGEGVNGTYNHCNSTCDGYMARCGDGNEDTAYGEACDEGDGVNGTYNHCSSDCTFVMKCGDGRTQSAYGENCDDGDDNGKYNHCSSNCRTMKTGYCGDGRLQRTDCSTYENCYTLEGGDEECDNGNKNGNTYCEYGDTSCEVCTKSCTPEIGKPAYCGDKKIQKGSAEECDAYVALDPVNNKLCDDVVTENCCEVVAGAEENCDDGDENGKFGKCDDTCSEIVTWQCGDGVVDNDHGETCDDGDENGQPHKCNTTCNGPALFCGDSRIQREECTYLLQCDEEITENCCEIVTGMHEACDKGDENGNPRRCYNDCSGFCGDGKIQKEDCGSLPLCDENTTENCCVVAVGVNEDCDEGYDFNGQSGHCNQICTGSTAVCGNGELEYGEACDDGNTADNDYCSADCQRITGYCGDGTVQTNETCDEGEENNGYHGHCNMACDGTSACGDGELGKDEFCDPSSTEETMIAEIQCSYLMQFEFTDETKIINSCTSDCVPILTTCEYNDAYKSPFFETGQTKCYSNSAEITCPASGDFYGQEPNFNYTPHDYEAIANGEIIKDNATGLMWETATPSIYGVETGLEGYGYQECAATSSCTAYEANFYCKFLTLGGYDDWRQPTAAELSTITDYASATHMYSGFTNTSGSYWTDEGFVFSTADGTLTTPSIDDAKIKCVRSVSEGSNCTSLQCREKIADSMFIFESPDTVMTVSANESDGSIIFNFWHFDDLSVGDSWKNALGTCSGFDNSNGLNKMRLPTVNELMWLIDRTNGGSLIPGFTGTAWTSTTLHSDPTKAYAVDFSTGSVTTELKNSNNIVICIE